MNTFYLLVYLSARSFLQTKKYADVIIPRGADNLVAINLIVQHIMLQLTEKEKAKHPPPHYHFGSPEAPETPDFQFHMDLIK